MLSEIQVHKSDATEGLFKTVLTPNATYNLLDLINGKTAALGVADLSTGTYTQIRLILAIKPDSSTNILGNSHTYANYLITQTDEPIKLKVPSGIQTGIKLVHPFNIVSGSIVGLILDFDAGRSVLMAGHSGEWLLKPTIKIIDTLNNATVTGSAMYGLGLNILQRYIHFRQIFLLNFIQILHGASSMPQTFADLVAGEKIAKLSFGRMKIYACSFFAQR